MNSNFRRLTFTVCLSTFLIFFHSTVYCQNHNIKNYNFNDGLPTQSFFDAVQDTTGRIWFACKKGLTVYDGYEWKFKSVKDGIPMANYGKITTDSKGRIWALPKWKRSKIVYFENEIWNSIPPIKKNSKSGGIVDFSIVSDNYPFKILVSTNSNIFFYNGFSWESLASFLPADIRIFSLYSCHNEFYICSSAGLFTFNPENKLLTEIKLFNNKTFSVLAVKHQNKGKNSGLYILNENWIGLYKQKKIKIITDSFSLSTKLGYENFYINIDSFNNIYFGNNETVFLKKAVTKYLNENFHSGASNVFIDSEENKWILTNRGLTKIIASPFNNFFNSDGLLENEISAIEQIDNQKILLGHNRGFTILKDGKFSTIEFKNHSSKNVLFTRVLDLKKFQNNIWFTASEKGLGYITDLNNIHWIEKNSLSKFSCMASHENILFIYKTDKLLKFNNTNFTSERKFQSKSPIGGRDIEILRDKTILIATNGSGILRVQNHTGKYDYLDNSTNKFYNNTYSIFVTKDSTILVGTIGGLCKIADSALVEHSLKNLNITNPIYFIEAGNKPGSLWFGLDKGVIYWEDGKVRHYDPNSGLAGYETNRHAGFLDNKGNFWIGTDQGLSMFPVGNEEIESPKPMLDVLYIEDMLFNKYPLTKSISLEHAKNSFSLHFRSMSFYDESNVIFYVKLLNLDGEIIEEFETKEKNARFTNLNSGDYRLSVTAKNPIGIFSDEFNSSIITIEAPFYNQSWFYIIIVLSLIVIGIIIQVFIFQRRYRKQLEIEVRERTKELEVAEKAKSQAIYENIENDRKRISRDLHDYLGQILTSAKLKLETFQFKKSVVDEQFEESLDLIQNTGKELRKIVHNLHPMEIEKYGLAASVEMMCNDVSKSSEIKTNFVRSNFCCEIDKQSEVMIYRIVQEALNNALKHSGATEANVIFEQIEDQVKIKISDNGKGFDINEKISASEKASSFGLVNMKQRAGLVGARFIIDSKPGVGTKITITLDADGKKN